MKKLLTLLSAFILTFIVVGCSSSGTSNNTSKTTEEKKGINVESLDPNKPVTVKIGATNVPHAELLEHVAPTLEKAGIKLDIVTYQDYYLPNKNLVDKEIDLNYFQHIPFLETEIKEKGYKLEDAGSIHVEPIALYSKKIKSLSELKEGALVLVSNNKAEWGRIIRILQKAELIKIKEGVDPISATFDDIVENPKNLKFKYDNDPAIMVQYYQNGEGDLVSINSNFAVDAGISPVEESVELESADNNPYANIIVVRAGDKDKIVTKKIVEVLQSEDVKKFIKERYKGAVIPA